MSYIGTAVQVVADWSCAITPFFIVWELQMPRKAKISVICILGLGILASIAALMRIISYEYIQKSKYPNDHMGRSIPSAFTPDGVFLRNITSNDLSRGSRSSRPMVSLRV